MTYFTIFSLKHFSSITAGFLFGRISGKAGMFYLFCILVTKMVPCLQIPNRLVATVNQVIIQPTFMPLSLQGWSRPYTPVLVQSCWINNHIINSLTFSYIFPSLDPTPLKHLFNFVMLIFHSITIFLFKDGRLFMENESPSFFFN